MKWNVIVLLVATGGVQSLWAHDNASLAADVNWQLDSKIREALKESQNRKLEPKAADSGNHVNSRAAPASTFVAGPGQWSDINYWDIIAIHATLLPTGKVLVWDATPDDFDDNIRPEDANLQKTRMLVWDPLNDNPIPADYNYDGADLFCAGFSHLWDGRVLFSGGDDGVDEDDVRPNGAIDHSTIYNPFSNTWNKTTDMASDRWYPGVAALPNGDVLSFGGTRVKNDINPTDSPKTYAEVFKIDENWRTLSNIEPPFGDLTVGEYQWAQTKPNGDVAVLGPHMNRYSINTEGQGKLLFADNSKALVFRSYGSYAHYENGKVLISGGGDANGAVNSAVIITLDDNNNDVDDDVADNSIDPMNFERRQHNLTILADGSVLATGGIKGTAGLVDGNPQNQIMNAEIWNPQTKKWTVGAAMNISRQYHSVALLLPDGRVLSGGGGYCLGCYKTPTAGKYSNQANYEIYEPPYLFDAGTGLRLDDNDRPDILQGQSSVDYDKIFTVTFNGDVSDVQKVHFVKLGAVTHSANQGQRLVKTDFTGTGNRLNIKSPQNRNIAPPGHYMIFIVDKDGHPSNGHMIRIGQPLLSEGIRVKDTILQEGEWNYYEIDPKGQTTVRVRGRDLDMLGDTEAVYIKAGGYPGAADFFGPITQEHEFVGPGEGPYYIAIKGSINSRYDFSYSLNGLKTDTPDVPPNDNSDGVGTSEIIGSRYSQTAGEIFWDKGNYIQFRVYRDGRELETKYGNSSFDPGLTPGKSHHYAVKALTNAGVEVNWGAITLGSEKRNYRSTRNDHTDSSNIAGTRYSQTAGEIFWNKGSYLQFRIYRDGEELETKYGNSFFDPGLTPRQSHHYVVKALTTVDVEINWGTITLGSEQDNY